VEVAILACGINVRNPRRLKVNTEAGLFTGSRFAGSTSKKFRLLRTAPGSEQLLPEGFQAPGIGSKLAAQMIELLA